MNRRLQKNSLEIGSSSGSSGCNEFMQENSGFPSKHKENSSAESRAIIDRGICGVCGIPSKFMCERCGDLYCSSKCQVKVWHGHRYICFPMPQLIKSHQQKQINEKLPNLQANVCTNTEIIKAQKEAYNKRRSASIPSSNSLPEDGSDIIITGFTSISHMSQKKDSTDDEASAMQNKEIYESNSSIVHNSQKDDSPDDAVNAMQKMEISLVRNNKTNNQHIEKETGMSVIDSPTKPENTRGSNIADGHCMVPPFKTIQFDPQLKNIKVIVLDLLRDGFLACIMESDLEHAFAATEYFENWKDNKEPYKPKSNEYCIAHFESEWFRAKVLKVLSEDRFLVSYIDYLNEGEVSSQSIRRYPMDLTIPCYTNLCGIVGLPEKLSDELVDYLQNTIALQKPLMVDKIHISEGITMINCEKLLQDLISRKLVQ